MHKNLIIRNAVSFCIFSFHVARLCCTFREVVWNDSYPGFLKVITSCSLDWLLFIFFILLNHLTLVAVIMLFLRPGHTKKRMSYCKLSKKWTQNQWESLIGWYIWNFWFKSLSICISRGGQEWGIIVILSKLMESIWLAVGSFFIPNIEVNSLPCSTTSHSLCVVRVGHVQ